MNNQICGILLINKPCGISSHETVVKVRRLVKQQRVGHTGTLDPLADGLLIVCIGRATKVVRYLTEVDKTYRAEIALGRSSLTYDREGVEFEIPAQPVPSMGDDEIEQLLGQFVGTIEQQVPSFSAVRVNGERLYEYARRGDFPEPPTRQVNIRKIILLSRDSNTLTIEVECSKGTYIRSLANDIGQKIGCGAYLSALKRTSIGRFDLNDAITLDELEAYLIGGTLEDHLLDYSDVFSCSALTVREDFRPMVVCGRTITAADIERIDGDFSQGERVVLKDIGGAVLAVGRAACDSRHFVPDSQDSIFSYERVLN